MTILLNAMLLCCMVLVFILLGMAFSAFADFHPVRLAEWKRKRTEVIQSALSLEATINVQLATIENDCIGQHATSSANMLNKVKGELCYVIDKLSHFKPTSTAALLDEEMVALEKYEARIVQLQKEIGEYCCVGATTT